MLASRRLVPRLLAAAQAMLGTVCCSGAWLSFSAGSSVQVELVFQWSFLGGNP